MVCIFIYGNEYAPQNMLINMIFSDIGLANKIIIQKIEKTKNWNYLYHTELTVKIIKYMKEIIILKIFLSGFKTINYCFKKIPI